MIPTIDETRDQIEAMIRQEGKFYRCVDYLEYDALQPPRCSPQHVLAELSSLVTDMRCSSPVESEAHNVSSLSPSHVNKFPSPKSSMADLRSLSQGSLGSTKCNKVKRATQQTSLSSWRHQMLDWAFTVTEIFNVDREIVAVAFSILDRYVAKEVAGQEAGTSISQEDFQLFGMVSMYITIKTLVPYRKLAVETLIDMSRGFYRGDDIISTERDILSSLNWHISPPTVMDFCRLYIRLLPQPFQYDIETTSQYFSELVLDDAYFLSKSGCLVALAITLLATQLGDSTLVATEGFLENMQGVVSIQSDEFDDIFQRLEALC